MIRIIAPIGKLKKKLYECDVKVVEHPAKVVTGIVTLTSILR